MKIISLLGVILLSIHSFGQGTKDSLRHRPIQYFFNVQSGSLIGCNNCGEGKQITFSFSTHHGVKIGNRLRVSMGTGLDSYFEWNMLPVYGNVSWDLFKSKNAFFVQFGYGHAIAAWRTMEFYDYGLTNTNPGKIYSYGAGYRVKANKMSVSFGIGQKVQQLTTKYEYPTYYWENGKSILGEPSKRTVLDEFSRLMFWMSVGLN
jgi:hypothetical protein